VVVKQFGEKLRYYRKQEGEHHCVEYPERFYANGQRAYRQEQPRAKNQMGVEHRLVENLFVAFIDRIVAGPGLLKSLFAQNQ